MEAKRSQSISNCVHLYEALPTTKSVPMLLHTVSSFLPGISSGTSACSHRLSGKVFIESCMDIYVFLNSTLHLNPSSIAIFSVCCDGFSFKLGFLLLTEYALKYMM